MTPLDVRYPTFNAQRRHIFLHLDEAGYLPALTSGSSPFTSLFNIGARGRWCCVRTAISVGNRDMAHLSTQRM